MGESPWWRIGWRNLARHPKRTFLTALGLGAGYFAVVFIVGWAEGITMEMVENATSLASGQIEIHAAEYRPERSLYETIGGRDGADVDGLLREVLADRAVVAAAPRVYAGGLISSGDSTSAGMLMGIDPELELNLSRFLDELADGRLPETGRNEMLIGNEMARQLVVGVGDALVVVAPGADGSMGNDLFEVSGIFRTGLAELDATFGIVPLDDLQTLVALHANRVHEVAVSTADPWVATATAGRLSERLAAGSLDLEVAPWTQLRPEMVEYVALVDSFYFIVFVVVFIIAMFGVANTMLMASFERRREFAVMLALGATSMQVALAVLSEALAIGSLSLLLGAAVTLPLMVWWHNAPPDLSWLYGELTMFGALLRPTLRVEYNVGAWLWGAVALLVTALLAALYPAARAARVPPADTLSDL
jgi:ABC-type lipoprotein release transport system permease subunit